MVGGGTSGEVEDILEDMLGHVWVCSGVFGCMHVCVCVAMFGHVWTCSAMYGYV